MDNERTREQVIADNRLFYDSLLQMYPHLDGRIGSELAADTDAAFKRFTCHDCPHVGKCGYEFDLYNTDGDCLAIK